MINASYRPAEEEDLSFIYNSWLKSYRNSSFAKNIPNEVYFNQHKNHIDSTIKSGKCLVLCNPDKPAQIFGYIVWSEDPILALHYVYIKHPYRKLGLAKKLLNEAIPGFSRRLLFTTHANHYWKEFSKKFNLVYNPYWRS